MKTLGRPLTIDLPPFQSRFPWLGSDLQTIRSSLFREMALPADQRLLAPIRTAKAGEALSVAVNNPAGHGPTHQRVLIMLHGLGGSEGSGYMLRTARYFNARGWITARVNFRGSGPSAPYSTPPYHGGLTEDILSVIETVNAAFPEAHIGLMGFSLGGHLTLKTLATASLPSAIKGGVSVSAPLNLENASAMMAKPRNAFYIRHLVKFLKADLRKYPTIIDPELLDKITRIREIDDYILAPKFGFSDRIDYYKKASVLSDLDTISLPTLAIHAADDPWIPVSDYESIAVPDDCPLSVLLLNRGGHLGFFTRGEKMNWFIPVAERYLAQYF